MNEGLLDELTPEELAILKERGTFDGIPVKCRGCGGRYHELTAKFVPATAVRGSYLRLLKAYGPSGRGWYDFPHQDWVVGDNVACPQCGTPYRARWLIRCIIGFLRPAVVEGGGDGASMPLEEVAVGDIVAPLTSQIMGEDEPGLAAKVLQLTWDGKTQAQIAETCGISVYMVRRFQKGERLQ